jgi:hypothetical protein
MSERLDGLHCVYGKCRGFPKYPVACHPGCVFRMTVASVPTAAPPRSPHSDIPQPSDAAQGRSRTQENRMP